MRLKKIAVIAKLPQLPREAPITFHPVGRGFTETLSAFRADDRPPRRSFRNLTATHPKLQELCGQKAGLPFHLSAWANEASLPTRVAVSLPACAARFSDKWLVCRQTLRKTRPLLSIGQTYDTNIDAKLATENSHRT